MYLSFLNYLEGIPKSCSIESASVIFLPLLRANCQFINIFLLIGAQKPSKANCSMSHCALLNTVYNVHYIMWFSTTLYSYPMLSKSHNPSFLTCCLGNSISEQPFLQQKLITIPQLPWAQLSPAGAASCGWALWWLQCHRQLKYFQPCEPLL